MLIHDDLCNYGFNSWLHVSFVMDFASFLQIYVLHYYGIFVVLYYSNVSNGSLTVNGSG